MRKPRRQRLRHPRAPYAQQQKRRPAYRLARKQRHFLNQAGFVLIVCLMMLGVFALVITHLPTMRP